MNVESDKAELDAYFHNRVERLKERIVQQVESLLGPQNESFDREFEEAVKGRLRIGAKFIPRKREAG